MLQTLIRQLLAVGLETTETLITGLLLQRALLSNGGSSNSGGWETGLLPSLPPLQNVHLLCSVRKRTELGIKRDYVNSSFNHLQLHDLGQIP